MQYAWNHMKEFDWTTGAAINHIATSSHNFYLYDLYLYDWYLYDLYLYDLYLYDLYLFNLHFYDFYLYDRICSRPTLAPQINRLLSHALKHQTPPCQPRMHTTK